ncbi:MAG: hypothetical protein M0036_08230 [Desulfobacteraceae bacterium]|nr:hypothetical protein [Desulfobacteraceae bacterium]
MQITIRMPDHHFEQLERIAAQMGLKKSDITRIAIKKFIEEQTIDKEKTPFAKARNLLGIVESGIADLGKNHRAHLIRKLKES